MITSTIKPSGGDYTTLSAWEADLPATLTDIEQAVCYAASISDTLAISGITTSASFYLQIIAATGENFTITGTDTSGTIRVGGSGVNHVRIEDITVIAGSGADGAIVWAFGTFASGSDWRIKRCTLKTAATGTNYLVAPKPANLNTLFENVIFIGSNRTWDSRGSASAKVYNCTAWRHAAELGFVGGSELEIKNTFSGHAGGASNDFQPSSGTPTGNNNAASDTTATANFSSSVDSVSSSVFTSVTSGSEDFTLVAGTNALVDAGATIGSFSDDIIGTSRPQGSAWDIGAFERVSSGFTGTIAATLPALTGSASGTITFSGTATTTLPALSGAATGWVEATGAGVATLPSLTASAQGAITFTGAATATLPALTADASGTFAEAGAVTGTAAATLPALTATASGLLTFTGTVQAILPALNADLSGWAQVTGDIAATLPSLTASGTGIGGEVTEAPPGGGWLPEHQAYRPGERRARGLEWDRENPKALRRQIEAAYNAAIGSPAAPEADAAAVIDAVKPFATAAYDTPAPPAAAVDWAAVLGNIDAVETLLAQIEATRRRKLVAVALLLLSV